MNVGPAMPLVVCAFVVTSLGAQTRPAAPAAPAPPAAPSATAPAAPPSPPAPPSQKTQPVNIKVDLTITDMRSSTLPEPVKKTVSVVTGDGLSGQVRSSSSYSGTGGGVPLNVDVEPTILANGKIRTHLSLAYDMPAPRTNEPSNLTAGTLTRTTIQETLWLILDDGKTLTISQSADPVTDRQVTVEVKATILK